MNTHPMPIVTWIAVLLATTTWACDEGTDPDVTGESHWLDCHTDLQCAPTASCVDGRCTPGTELACAGSQALIPLDDNHVVVRGPASSQGEGCTARPPGMDDPHFCRAAGANADIALSDGAPVAVVCSSLEGANVVTGDGPWLTTGDRHTIHDARGDLALNGPNHQVRGDHLTGDLTITGNNARASDLAIDGDLTIIGNNAGVSLTAISGNVVIEGSGAVLIGVRVYGDLVVNGVNAVLVGVGTAGEWNPDERSSCYGCYSFDGEYLATTTRQAELTCQPE